MKKDSPLSLDARFHTTQWRVIEECLESEPGLANEGLSTLCRLYWQPVYVHIRQRGHTVHDAQDYTQDFFIYILQGSFLERADRYKGRFRTFLLTCLQNFLSDQKDQRASIKRGGKVHWLPLEGFPTENMETNFCISELPPDFAFDLVWAETVIDLAMNEVQECWAKRKKRRIFLHLQPLLTDPEESIQYDKLTARLDLGVVSLRNEIHRMKVKMRDCIRGQVALTVSTPEEVDDEIRYLMRLLALRDRMA